MFLFKLIVVNLFLINFVNAVNDPANPAFDKKIYEEALNPELCAKHIKFIKANPDLYFAFLDRGLRIPKGISEGNSVNLGNYHACLDINRKTSDDVIYGKYCMIEIPITDNFKLPSIINISKQLGRSLGKVKHTGVTNESMESFHLAEKRTKKYRKYNRNQANVNTTVNFTMKLGMCLPKSCTAREAMDKMYFKLSLVGLQLKESYCRLLNDKPWTLLDTVAMVILIMIALVTMLSTSYDIYNCLKKKKDPKEAHVFLRGFSVYTNTRRLLTFNKVPGTIECIDGIRAFAMTWVILGHSFVSIAAHFYNLRDVLHWLPSVESLWIMSATMAVDTFFTLSGLLLVYTTTGKLTGEGLLKKIPLFYMNRLLRLFPLLAFTIILQISIFHRIADGPNWQTVEEQVNYCRVYWWTNLLYIQNYYNPMEICLQQTWYLTVDMQLYFISPLVLYWVLSGKRKQAWIALTAAFVLSITSSTIFIFVKKISFSITDEQELEKYKKNYYINTLTRSPAFIVGMIYGYILSLGRNKKIVISRPLILVLWSCALVLAGTVIYTIYYQNNHYDKCPTANSLINAFNRPAWAMVIGWIVLACNNGYGGPLNWMLTSGKLKLISRLSYSMYLMHLPIIFVYAGSMVSLRHFDVLSTFYIFVSHFTMSLVCGFIITVLVDSPASIFIKFLQTKGSNPLTDTTNVNNLEIIYSTKM